MKRILIALIISVCLFSCSKDKNDDTINSGHESYKPDASVTADEPVMYTKDGVIHDKAVIKNYLTRRQVLSYYVFDQSTGDASGLGLGSYTLEFTSDKNVLLGNIKGEITSKNDTLMMIAGVETSVSEPGQKSLSDSLMDMVNKNGPLAECPTYYTAPCPYKKKYPMLIKGSEYYIPYVVATASTNVLVPTMLGVPMDYTYFTHKQGESMLFNESMITKLGGTVVITSNNLNYVVDKNDTLVIQQLRRRMIKQ
jgi:uncharacterized protein YcfL